MFILTRAGITTESEINESIGAYAIGAETAYIYIRGEYRDLPSWFSKTYSDYKMLDPDGKPVGTQVCLQHEGFRRQLMSSRRFRCRVSRLMALLFVSGSLAWGALAQAQDAVSPLPPPMTRGLYRSRWFEFLDALAAREEWREIPVIVITARQLTAGERERLLRQARKVLEKATATRVDIAAAIGEAIRRRHVAPAPN